MKSFFKKWLRDPWMFFTIFTILLSILLSIVPQFQLIATSMKEEGGAFFLKAEPGSGSLETIPQANKIFEVKGNDQSLLVTRKGKQFFTIKNQGSGKLLFVFSNNRKLKYENLAENKIRITGDRTSLVVSQKTFTMGFGQVVKSIGLSARIVSKNTALVSYQDGAYLNFEDVRQYYTFQNYIDFLSQDRYCVAIKNSLIVMVLATLFAAILAVSLAYYFARYDFSGKAIMISLITMASISPPFLGGYAWRMLLGNEGIITRMFHWNFSIVGIHGVIWVIIWLIFPLIFLMTYNAFLAMDRTLVESSLSLGANKRKTLFKIIIPLAMPGIITGVYLGMMTAFTDFGTPYVISVNLNVLPVLVYKEYLNEVGSNFSIASTGSMIMIGLSSLILMAQRLYLATKSYSSLAAKNMTLMKPTKGKKVFIIFYSVLLIFLSFVPHLTVAITSFLKWSSGIVKPIFTVENYTNMFSSELNSIYVSFFLGITATMLCVIFGIAIAYVIVKKRYRFFSNFLNILVMVPYIIPGTVLGIGFIMLFNNPPVILTGTWIILVLAYFIRKLPYSVKSVESVLYQIHPALEEAAKSLGARPLKSFKDIVLKLIISGIISGVCLTFFQIMTEISATIVLYRPPWKPMTAVIFENCTSAGSDFGLASSMTVLLMLCLYIPLYMIIAKTTKTGKKVDDDVVTY